MRHRAGAAGGRSRPSCSIVKSAECTRTIQREPLRLDAIAPRMLSRGQFREVPEWSFAATEVGVVTSGRAAFRWLWAGQTASVLGTAVSGLAIPTIAIVGLGAAPFAVGVLSTVQFAAFPLLGLFAGVWVDRWSRRATMLVADVIRALALATIPLAAFAHVLGFAQLVAVAACVGAASVFFEVAYQSLVPSIAESRRARRRQRAARVHQQRGADRRQRAGRCAHRVRRRPDRRDRRRGVVRRLGADADHGPRARDASRRAPGAARALRRRAARGDRGRAGSRR